MEDAANVLLEENDERNVKYKSKLNVFINRNTNVNKFDVHVL